MIERHRLPLRRIEHGLYRRRVASGVAEAQTAASLPERGRDGWPYRNQFLVTVVAMRAYALGVEHLLVGTVKSDEFHADGRAEFYHQLDALVAMQEGKIRIETPASKMTSVDLVRAAGIPLSLLGWTHSCHLDEFACGQCRGCCKHAQVFAEVQNANAPIA